MSRWPGSDRWHPRPGRWVAQFIGAVTFYTCLPIPQRWPMHFEGIARYAPWVGVVLGGGLALVDWGWQLLGLSLVLRSGLLVALSLALTGGLHLDGAMDTADGLAVPDRDRRLTVMADSRAGAFGVMVAIVILGLKTLALMDLSQGRWFGLMAAAGWGRWGQVVAIARYPYLRAEGKGALHKQHACATDWLVGLLPLAGLVGVAVLTQPVDAVWFLSVTGVGGAIALLTGLWLHCQLGGHTGDTYGAIVEWTEVGLLCSAVVLRSLLYSSV